MVLPNLVPAVTWGPEVLTWNHNPKRRDMLPFVKRMICVANSDFNQPLTAGVLPPNLTQLTFGADFDQPLAAGVLPPNLVGRVYYVIR